MWERQLKVPEVVRETAYGTIGCGKDCKVPEVVGKAACTRGCGKGSLKYQRLWERQFKVPEVVRKQDKAPEDVGETV